MTDYSHRERVYTIGGLDAPKQWKGIVAADNECGAQGKESERPLEILNCAQDLLAKVDFLDLLRCCTPVYVDLKEVRQDRLREVERNTTEKDGEHRDPLWFIVLRTCTCNPSERGTKQWALRQAR